MVPLPRFVFTALLLLVAVDFCAAASPPITSELEVTPPALEVVANATHPAIATDGADFLVVWKSLATGTFTLTAARVTGEGRLLDPLGISLSGETQNAAWMAPPEVLWMDGRYLVTSPSVNAIDVLAVERDGQVAARKTVATIPIAVEHRTATNGERMLIAWDGGRATILDRNLQVIRDLVLSGSTIESVVASGSEFVVFSGMPCAGADCPRTIVADRFSADGERLSVRTTIDSATKIDALVVARGGGRLILFDRVRTPTPEDPWAAPLTAVVLDELGQPAGDPIVIRAQIPFANRMRAATNREGDAILIVEMSGQSLVARVDLATRSATVQTLDGQPQAALAFGPASTLLVTGNKAPWNATLVARFVDRGLADDPSRRERLTLTVAAASQQWPVVQTNGRAYLITWTETTGTVAMSKGALLDAHGKRIGSSPGLSMNPTSIASDGNDFLLVGSNGSSIVAQRVSANGAVLDVQPIVVAGGWTPQPRVVWNGNAYVVFTAGAESSVGAYGHVDAIRIDRSGTVLDTTPISTRQSAQLSTLAASSDDRTLVVWRDVSTPPGCTKFCTRIVRVEGVVLDRENHTVATPLLSASPPDPTASPAALSVGGGSFLLTWWRLPAPREARLVRISEEGAPLDESVLAGAIASEPVAAWNGQMFDLAWLEERGGDIDVAFRRGVSEPVLLTVPGLEQSLSACSIEGVSTLIAYTRRTNDALHGSTTRLFVRVAPLDSAVRRRPVRH